MVLEAIILCMDNSDWNRNGDYSPTRWASQVEAANLIIENHCQANPENGLGIISMAGKRVEVHSSLTNDESRLLNVSSRIQISGESDIITALNIATLTLKHRINKNQKQRIILFVGSPLRSTKEELALVGKKLKKYNISVDIISFGHIEQNKDGLTSLLNSVNNANSSSLLEVPVGNFLVDFLLSSPIMNPGGGDLGGNMGMPADQNFGNINQQGQGLSQFERDLNLAMQMSLQEAGLSNNNNQNQANNNPSQASAGNSSVPNPSGEAINEEEELEKAKLLSKIENDKVMKAQNEQKEKDTVNEALASPDFIKDILGEVSGENVKEEDVNDIMKEIHKEKDKSKEDKKEEKKEDKKEGKKDDKMDVDKE